MQRRIFMKKLLYTTLFLGVFIVAAFSTVEAQNDALPSVIGVRLNDPTYCNDYYLVCSMMDTKIYECHGYEYGCSANDRILTGTVRVAGGYAYFGLTGNYISQKLLSLNGITITLATKSGPGNWAYWYAVSGDIVVSNSGTSTYSLVVGWDPNMAPGLERGPDNSILY